MWAFHPMDGRTDQWIYLLGRLSGTDSSICKFIIPLLSVAVHEEQAFALRDLGDHLISACGAYVVYEAEYSIRFVGGVAIAGGVGSLINLSFSSIIIGIYEVL